MAENLTNNMDYDDIPLSIEATSDVSVSIETTDETPIFSTLVGDNTSEQVQRRTFSDWSYTSDEFMNQLIEAGFYSCNYIDRVICLNCNIICQSWKSHTDNPSEVHRTLSPKCSYVQSKLMLSQQTTSPRLPVTIDDLSPTVNVVISPNGGIRQTIALQFEEIIPKTYKHPDYAMIPHRQRSFNNCSIQNLQLIDNLVQAGFFYTKIEDIVTCFYCGGSLQNWKTNTNPKIEHSRWFPDCHYARHLCGQNLYYFIQQAQEKFMKNEQQRQNLESKSDIQMSIINQYLSLSDKNLLSQLVVARLDLPISQRSINDDFCLPIVKRCWEDQLKIKKVDFFSEKDLIIACAIRQKQDKYLANSTKNLIIPSIRMKEIASNRVVPYVESFTTSNNNSQSREISTEAEDSSRNCEEISNPCVVCLSEETCLACLPCGHFVTCVPCGHSLKTCPICRSTIESYARKYI